MLREAGYADFRELYADVPESMLIGALDIPSGLSEFEVRSRMEALAAKNVRFTRIFRGAGAYDHFIPAIVGSVTSKEEFVTAYTPYQAEISQGILQNIFEYQTMICELTGLDVANASVYDGASAMAEAAAMCADRKRGVCLISACVDPQSRSTVASYCFGSGMELVEVPEKDGRTDMDALAALLSDKTACVCLKQPNRYGIIEDVDRAAQLAHAAGAKLVESVYAMSLPLLRTPAECGADICVGEGQPFGMPLSFGGPYLGFMACRAELMRRLPGRIVGETHDAAGERAFVLTLQAREQHIRREKAGSNICSNEALCALTAAVYLSAMGPEGLKNAACQCVSKAHYLADRLCAAGLKLQYGAEFFNEFVTVSDVPADRLLARLAEKGILGGLPLGEHEILWCCTEKNSRADIDEVADTVKEAVK